MECYTYVIHILYPEVVCASKKWIYIVPNSQIAKAALQMEAEVLQTSTQNHFNHTQPCIIKCVCIPLECLLKYPSMCIHEKWGTSKQVIMKFYIGTFYEKVSRHISCSWNQTNVTDSLHTSIRLVCINACFCSIQTLTHSFIPLACAEFDDSLPFSGASSIPVCYVLFPATLPHQLFFQPLSPNLAINFLVYISVLLFANSFGNSIFFHSLYISKHS